MFICPDCAKPRDLWSGVRSYGPCEICRKPAACYDIPSHRIPEPTPPPPPTPAR